MSASSTAGSADNSIIIISVSENGNDGWEEFYNSGGYTISFTMPGEIEIPDKWVGKNVYFKIGIRQGGTSTQTALTVNSINIEHVSLNLGKWRFYNMSPALRHRRVSGSDGNFTITTGGNDVGYGDIVSIATTTGMTFTSGAKLRLLHSSTAGSAYNSQYGVYLSNSNSSDASWTQVYSYSVSLGFSQKEDIIDIPSEFIGTNTYIKLSTLQGGTSNPTTWNVNLTYTR